MLSIFSFCQKRSYRTITAIFAVLAVFSINPTLLALDSAKERNKPPTLWEGLEEKAKNYELERINHIFAGLDALFAKAIIKVKNFDQEDPDLEKELSLLHFLIGPHELNEIIVILKKNPKKELKELNAEFFSDAQINSFLDAVRHLYKKNLVDEKEAEDLLVSNAPLNGNDIAHLIENGAVQSKDGFFVQLRTGMTFGDTLKLHNDVMTVLREAQKNCGRDFPDISLADLLNGPFGFYILKALKEAGLSDSETIEDANLIQEMRKHFLFLMTSNGINLLLPNSMTTNPSLNPFSAAFMLFSSGISAVFLNNFFLNANAKFSSSIGANPYAYSYSGSWGFSNESVSWWAAYVDGYLGGGLGMAFNLSPSSAPGSFLSMGLSLGGWKDNLTLGATFQILMASFVGIGAGAFINVARAHDVAYLGKYPLDGKYKKIRGLHKIEIKDKKGIGGNAALIVNFSSLGVPIASALKAGAELTRLRIFRTHTTLGRAQEMLEEGNLPGLLYLAGDKIMKTRQPKFTDPEALIDGDELLERKCGKISGGFVVGLQTIIPYYIARVGADMRMVAEFELGLKRLPEDKFEVSIEPKNIHEISFFGSIFDVVGAGIIKAMAIARKQIYIFDWKQVEARKAYFKLIDEGILPDSGEIEVSTEEHGAEYLLAEFRKQNQEMAPKGVQRIYLEKIRIDILKTYVGINSPLVPTALKLISKAHYKLKKGVNRLDFRFEGLEREFLQSQTKCIATNGIVAVKRTISRWQRSKGQAFSGRYQEELLVAHERIYTIEELPSGHMENKWQFGSLVVFGQLKDTKITGNEENKMISEINSLFSTFIGSFEQENSKVPRVIALERVINRRDLPLLLAPEAKERIGIASQVSGIPQSALWYFLKDLKNKHPDLQADLVKRFIQSRKDLKAFAALHQLMGAKPEDLKVLTESSYKAVIDSAEQFIATSSDPSNESQTAVNLTTSKSTENKKKIINFYSQAREHINNIDTQLRFLYDDQYLIDDNSKLNKIYGKEKVKELIKIGARQDKVAYKTGLVSARKTIYELMDLKKQGFNDKDCLKIYKLADNKNLRFIEQGELLLNKIKNKNLDAPLPEKLEHKVWEMIGKIDTRIDKLKNDLIMASMDKEYVDNQIEALSALTDLLHKALGD